MEGLMRALRRMIGIGLVGYGYWGPNLARNFAAHEACRLVGICELKRSRSERATQHYPQALITADYQALLNHPDIQAIAIATPVKTHYPLARAALLANKDVFLEKPIAETVAEAEELMRLATERGRILAIDHTYLFTGAVQKINEIVSSGELGEVMYFDSVRINLGLFQSDVNVIYDLAPHDLSILCHLFPQDPLTVRALGPCRHLNGTAYLAYLHLEYADGLVAHFHLNWFAPVKIRRILVGGTRKMLVYDDMEPSEKVKVYDKGIVFHNAGVEELYRVQVDYRTGDMVAPKLLHKEALQSEVEHFCQCVRSRSRPLADGYEGLRVLRILNAADGSLRDNGARVRLEDRQRRAA
jgi:predicted dehydrogenase